jgi:proline dehydrogenase
MLRSTLLYLSRQPQLRRWMETSPLAKPLTRRFVAGQSLERAVEASRRINAQGIEVSLDHLGENVQSMAEAAASRDQALRALRAIEQQQLRATISVKVTQLGLDLGDAVCRENVEAIVREAARIGTRIEFDMESSAYVDRTLAIVESMHQRYGCVRAVIQAYLKRSGRDVDRLCGAGIPVRLCKGAYDEPEEVAFREKTAVDENYLRLANVLLEKGVDPALATHDEKMLTAAEGAEPQRFEVQMLYGVRRDLQQRIVAAGRRLRVYLPYGDAWYPYFMRRLAERPANLWFVMRSVFGN